MTKEKYESERGVTLTGDDAFRLLKAGICVYHDHSEGRIPLPPKTLEQLWDALVQAGYTEAEERGEEPSYWCATNDCDRAECHRCFPRKGCTLHGKCVRASAVGAAFTVAQAKECGAKS